MAAAFGVSAIATHNFLSGRQGDSSQEPPKTQQQATPQRSAAPQQPTTQQQPTAAQPAVYDPAPARTGEMRLTGHHMIVLLDMDDDSKTTAVDLYFQNNAGGRTSGFTKISGPGLPATVQLLATMERHKVGTLFRLDCNRGSAEARAGSASPNTFSLTPDKDLMFLRINKGVVREMTRENLTPTEKEYAMNVLSRLKDQPQNSFDIKTVFGETTHKYTRDGGR